MPSKPSYRPMSLRSRTTVDSGTQGFDLPRIRVALPPKA
jgi:hypothetical protein